MVKQCRLQQTERGSYHYFFLYSVKIKLKNFIVGFMLKILPNWLHLFPVSASVLLTGGEGLMVLGVAAHSTAYFHHSPSHFLSPPPALSISHSGRGWRADRSVWWGSTVPLLLQYAAGLVKREGDRERESCRYRCLSFAHPEEPRRRRRRGRGAVVDVEREGDLCFENVLSRASTS